MKNLLCIFLGLGMIFIWSCSDNKKSGSSACLNDNAEYYYNGVLFNTMHLPEEGEILTLNGESCGIGAAYNTSQNILTLRILGEDQDLNIHAEVTDLNTELGFRFLQYTNNNTISSFNDVQSDSQNYILIEELDTLANTIRGEFKFQIQDPNGDKITVDNGMFNCSINTF
mgnify:CR=1 FL=1